MMARSVKREKENAPAFQPVREGPDFLTGRSP